MEPKSVFCITCNKSFIVTNPRSRQTFCSKECRPARKHVSIASRDCQSCHTTFIPTYNCQQYCSKDCRWKGFSTSRKVIREQIRCQTCNAEFIPKRKGKLFCSHKCSRNQNPPVTKQCETCLKDFTVAYRFRGQKTCGRECAAVATSKALKTRETKQCLACNADFEVVQSYKDKGKYCSYKCFLSTRKTHQPDVIKTCEFCKKEFSVPFPSQEQRFCSRGCAHTGDNNGMRIHPETCRWRGNHSWNHGLTTKSDNRLRLLGEKISVIVADKMVAGTWSPPSTGFKGEHFTGIKNGGKQIYLRSSYESIYVRILEADIDVLSWEYEPMRLPYLFKGSIRNYVPDFLVTYVDDLSFLVEVKPSLLVDNEQNTAKRLVAEAWCQLNNVGYLVFTEKSLVLND